MEESYFSSISDEKIYLSSLAKGVYLLKIILIKKYFLKKIIHNKNL